MHIDKVPGIGLTAMIAIPALFIGAQFPVIGSPILGIIFGMLVSFWKRPPSFESGISFSSKYVLQFSIILMGFSISLDTVFHVGVETIWLILLTLIVTFVVSFFIGKLLKIGTKSTILIGVGTAICGGSAIAATAPVIQASQDDVARSMSTIFLFNIMAVLSFPFLGQLWQMSDYVFGLWAGTAINDTSAVVAAGYTFSQSAGDIAVIVKLTRTLLIVPITIFLAFYTMRVKTFDGTSTYKLSRVFPWFILGFIMASLLNTLLPLPIEITNMFTSAGKFMIVMAMTAIGLHVNITEMTKGNSKLVLLGLGCWITLSLTSFTILNLFF